MPEAVVLEWTTQIWLTVRRVMPLDRVDTVDRFVDGLAVLFRR